LRDLLLATNLSTADHTHMHVHSDAYINRIRQSSIISSLLSYTTNNT